jgi:ATP phosphoribosyltransferase
MENVTLTITDLATLRNIVDLASTRGAFRANELREVGEIYDRLNRFIDASIAASQAQQEEQTTDTPESDNTKGE